MDPGVAPPIRIYPAIGGTSYVLVAPATGTAQRGLTCAGPPSLIRQRPPMAGRGYKPAPDINKTAPSAIRKRPGQFVPSPRNRKLRRGGSKVSRAGREESRPLSGPRQIAVRAMYRIPMITKSAPSPIRNILASLFVAAPHNTTGLKHPASKTFRPSAAIQRVAVRVESGMQATADVHRPL